MRTLPSRSSTAAQITIALNVLLFAGACATHGVSNAPARADTLRERGFVESTNAGSIYYERAGSGPAVVLIHGLGGNHAVWYRQVPRLSAHRTVVTVSQRGFAPSTGERVDIDVNELVGDLVAVLDALEIERAAIIGQSMGGWTALQFALSHPQRTSALILADTFAGIFDDRSRSHYDAVAERARSLAAEPPPLGFHPALDSEFSLANPEDGYLYQLLSTFGSPRPADVVAALGRQDASTTALSRNQVPTLFIVGERDAIFPPSLVEHVSTLLAASRVRVIPGAGHSPYYETPDAWADVVESFLDAMD